MVNRISAVKLNDLVWVTLFGLFAWLSPHGDWPELEVLALLLGLELAEPRVEWFAKGRGAATLVLTKLVLSYLFIGLSGGINSTFYLLLLLPIVTAANRLNAWATALVVALSSCAYLSFLLFLNPERHVLGVFDQLELLLRVLFLVMGGFLTFQQAERTREAAQRYLQVAEKLEEANAELKVAESAVRRSDRLAALGQLTAGLAHELRNPLGTIRASAELLLRREGGDETSKELIGYVSSEVDRANSLVTRFLEFARPLKMARQPLDLAQVLDEAVRTAENQMAGRQVRFVKNYAPEIPTMEGDPELLRMAVVNLAVNAAQASAEGSAVTIKTKLAGGIAEISVIDRGSGIAKEHLDTVFNPFFTTKADGVGLGLPIVAKIVDEHRGKLAVSSTPDEGTVFQILLPIK